jgi:hypothetical protein
MTVPTPLQIALRQSRTRPTVVRIDRRRWRRHRRAKQNRRRAGTGAGTVVQCAQVQSGLETPDGGGVANDVVFASANGRGR